ncbi:hypothetical protein EJ03DRAFT_328179 [Teratosphaeria nubilosa]|uniref:Secreted protein n=1 Tax=Teratosphaeria nubilosa TaxID=161662 RepID=A0A6G1L7W6_9PEZI|nr:hypothetical protein EJ03DRAFT_328179 [Teratosphaeria nubilosa]
MKSILTIAASTFLLASLPSVNGGYGKYCRCRGPAAAGQPATNGPDMPEKTKIACKHYNDGTYRQGTQSYVKYDEPNAQCMQDGVSLLQEYWNDICIMDGAASGQCWNDVPAPGWTHARCRGPAPKGQPATQGPDMPAVSRQACSDYNGGTFNGFTATVAYYDPSDECRSDNGSLDPPTWDLFCKNHGGASGQCWK